MPRNPVDPMDALANLANRLSQLIPGLSTVRLGLEDINIGGNATLNRYANSVAETGRSLARERQHVEDINAAFRRQQEGWNQAIDDVKIDRRVAERAAEEAQANAQRLGDALRVEKQESARLRASGQGAQRLQTALHSERQESTRLRSALETLQHTSTEDRADLRRTERRLHESEVTVDELRAELRAVRYQLQHANDHNHLNVPSSPNSAGRPSSDSGVSGISAGSSAANAGDKTRQRVALNLYHDGVQAFNRGDHRTAVNSFTDVQVMSRQLPESLRQAFNSTDIAYYHAVCQAETANDNDAKQALLNFCQDYENATDSQSAHIRHLLARTYVKLGRLDDAFAYCCEAVGLRYNINPADKHHFDSVALLVRILQLQDKAVEATSIVNDCPASWRVTVQTKYTTLQGPSNTQPRTGQTTLPVRTVPRPANSVIASDSGRTTTTAASKRKKQVQTLPPLYRHILRNW